MARLFISHSSRDNFEAQAFYDWLVSVGWAPADIFLDLHDIGAGARWKEALAKANERCEAVVLLASPASLASTECRLEIRMAEDYGKEIIVAILHLLRPEDDALGPYREKQIVDLGLDPCDATFEVTHKGQTKAIHFSRRTLNSIKARLDQLGISPTTFVWRPADPKSESPYPGLEGFTHRQAGLFFGRASDIARGMAEIRRLRRIATGQMLVLQAASGAGKSSFLKAGLWPRLDRDPDFLPIAILRPANGILTGENGIGRQLATYFSVHDKGRALNAAKIHAGLAGAADDAAAFLSGLIRDATEIGHAIQRTGRPDAPAPTPLLAVDQAEELFAADDKEESSRFLAILARILAGQPQAAGQQASGPAPLVLLTIRADSLDALLHATDVAGLKPPQPFLLPPIPKDSYREIIEAPKAVANQAGMVLEIDPFLVNTLIAESVGADALPLLAFTLRQLVEECRSGAEAKLTLDAYRDAGGLAGVLSKRLAAALRTAQAQPEALRRLVIPHLATWDPDSSPPAAKRLVATEDRLLAGERATLQDLANALVEARLLTRSGSAIEVAHEALLRLEPLSSWLAESREFLVWRDQVKSAMSQYNSGSRGLLGTLEIVNARRFLDQPMEPDAIEGPVRKFIEASFTEMRESLAAEARKDEERRRALDEAERARAKNERELQRALATTCKVVAHAPNGSSDAMLGLPIDETTVVAPCLDPEQSHVYEIEHDGTRHPLSVIATSPPYVFLALQRPLEQAVDDAEFIALGLKAGDPDSTRLAARRDGSFEPVPPAITPAASLPLIRFGEAEAIGFTEAGVGAVTMMGRQELSELLARLRSRRDDSDVFISYALADRAAALRLRQRLDASGYTVWMDHRRSAPEVEGVVTQAAAALESARRVVVLWSRASVQSRQVLEEAKRAREAGKLIAAHIEPMDGIRSQLPPDLAAIPALDLMGDQYDHARLLTALGVETETPSRRPPRIAAEVDISKLPPDSASRLYGRARELDDLLAAWDGQTTRIAVLEGIAGAGKTAVVNYFVQAMRAAAWRGAERVFAWSFHSQGSVETLRSSTEEFFASAFSFFSGGSEPPPPSPHDKGSRLASLVRQSRALLVLDGLEPLQQAAGARAPFGAIKDAGIRALLYGLRDASTGLAIITTRIKLPDLAGMVNVVTIALGALSLTAAIEMIRDLGVEPTFPPDSFDLPTAAAFRDLARDGRFQLPADYDPPPGRHRNEMPATVARELIELVVSQQGHPLGLTLVATQLARYHGGDARARTELALSGEPDGERGTFPVLRAVEAALLRQVIELQPDLSAPARTAAGRQLALLYMYGLFDHPVPPELIPVVFAGDGNPDPVLDPADARDAPDLSDDYAEHGAIPVSKHRMIIRRLFAGMAQYALNGPMIAAALHQLSEQGIVTRADRDMSWIRAEIECHPVVREFFASRLREIDPATFEQAHGRLFDYLRLAGLPTLFHDPVAYGILVVGAVRPQLKPHLVEQAGKSPRPPWWSALPAGLREASTEKIAAGMVLIDVAEGRRAQEVFQPADATSISHLFSAIWHGCLAGRQKEAFNEVYWPRISRGSDQFATRKLGLFGAELAALASFFDTPFVLPTRRLDEADRTLLLMLVSTRLRALGRLADAVAPMRAAVRAMVAAEDGRRAASTTEQLAALLLTLGQIEGGDGALAAGYDAMMLAEREGESFLRMFARATALAPALLAAGAIAPAEAVLREAGELQADMMPASTQFFSNAGFELANLLLARGRLEELEDLGQSIIEVASVHARVLDRALGLLVSARKALAAPLGRSQPRQIEWLTSEAISSLRIAGIEDVLPYGLLARAEAAWLLGEAEDADRDLRELDAVVARGPMPLFAVDAVLLRARMAVAGGDFAKAMSCRDQAAVLIERHGYRRAIPELNLLVAEIAAATKAPMLEPALERAIAAVLGGAATEAIQATADRYAPGADEIDGGWWGLWPRLDAILPAGHEARRKLEAARQAYNAERDRYLARQALKRDAEWEQEDRALADPSFRRDLSTALEASGHPPLDKTPLAEQRNDARSYLAQIRNLFSDPEAQEVLRTAMSDVGLTGSPEDLPMETKRALLKSMLSSQSTSDSST